MTNEEAIKMLKLIKSTVYLGNRKFMDAVDMAIEALSCSEIPNNSDTVYRQAAIDALGEEPPIWYDGEDELAERNQWRRDVNAIKALPSAQPEHENVRCKDCKHKTIENDVWTCPFGLPGGPEFFCGYGAERRKDE